MDHGTNLRFNVDKFVDPGNYRWTTNEARDEIFEPIPGRMARKLGLSGLAAGILWIGLAILVSNGILQILFCTIACLFPVSAFLFGKILDHFGEARGPLLILRRDRTIVLPRMETEIVPNEETYVEVVPDSEKFGNMRFTLVICRGEERWPVVGGGFSPWLKLSPLESLFRTLQGRYPMPDQCRCESLENELARHKAFARNFLRTILLILGLWFTGLGSFFLCTMPEQEEGMVYAIGFLAVMIINDDLEAFLRIPQEFGRKAGQTLEYVTFTKLLTALATMFSAANKNRITNKLSVGGLDAASKLFGEQVDKSGGFTLVQPALLLVPPALGATAKTLHTSTSVNETTVAGKPSPTDNPWAGSFKPIVSPFMGGAFSFDVGTGAEKVTYTGKDSGFLLLADPLDVACIEIAFLNGQRNPIIESGEMDFNKLGMAWRCYFDFGVGLLDPSAGVYSDGTTA